jgi:hypothetical protein
MKSENLAKAEKEYYNPQDLEHPKQTRDIKNVANEKIRSLKNKIRELKKEIVELKQERRRLRHLHLAVYQEIVASNSTNSELNDRIEKTISMLEDRDDVSDVLRVLNGEGNEVYFEREEQTEG